MMVTRNVKVMIPIQIGFRKNQFDKFQITDNFRLFFINEPLSLNID